MEFIVLLIMVIISYLILKYIFDVNMKEFKKFGKNEELDKLTEKYPENIEICKEYLKMLNNENVIIEEDKNSNSTLYLVISNKIFIANLRNSYTRVQTIAHECLHSVQSKKLLWFNFIFSNIYIFFFIIISILGVLKMIKYKMLFICILIILGLIFYSVRTYLENDAMIKARFLAEKYMKQKKILEDKDIEKIVSEYDALNALGVKMTNFKILNQVIYKIIVILIIFCIF